MSETSRRIIIEGEGLDAQTPEQVNLLMERLRGLVGNMDISLVYMTPDLTENSEAAATPEISLEGTIELTELEEFTRQENNEFTEQAAQQLWHGLEWEYFINRQRPIQDACPVRFLDNPDQQSLLLGQRHSYRHLVLDSLLPTAQWLQKHPDRRGFGDKSKAVLAGYINEKFEPDEPIVFIPKQPYVPVVIPPAETFQVDETSPYVDEVRIKNEALQLVTAAAMKRFATVELGLVEHGNRNLDNLDVMLASVAEILYGTDPDDKRARSAPAEVIEGLYVIGRTEDKKTGRSRAVWGVTPRAFVETIENDLTGEFRVANMRGKKTAHIVTRYIRAIAQQIL